MEKIPLESKKEQIIFTCPNPDCMDVNVFNLVACEACFTANGQKYREENRPHKTLLFP